MSRQDTAFQERECEETNLAETDARRDDGANLGTNLGASLGTSLSEGLKALEQNYRQRTGNAYLPPASISPPPPTTDPHPVSEGVEPALADAAQLLATIVSMEPAPGGDDTRRPPGTLGPSSVAIAPASEAGSVKTEIAATPTTSEAALATAGAAPVTAKPAPAKGETTAAPQARAELAPPVKNGPAPQGARGSEATRTADPPTDAGGGGPGKGGGSGGGGGGGGGRKPMEKRSGDSDFREVLGKGLASCRLNLITVAIFSAIINLLILAVPIYLFQISDRVLTSRSIDTLIMLTVIVMAAIGAHVLLDMVRRHILMRIAVDAEVKLGAPVLSAAAKAAQNGSSREFQTLADLQQIRAFLTGPVLLTMFDAPVAPIYLLVVFLIHPHIGYIVAIAGAVLLLVALINQKVTAVSFARSNAFGTRANIQAEAMARNAQIINAMGMIPEGVQIWGRETAESLKSQVVGHDRNIAMTGVSKFFRQGAQVAILSWGAWLALHSELTGGMIIAASIIGSRALAPLEGTIEGWRSFVNARLAYARVKTLLQNSPLNFERLRLPRPEGRLSVERILYVPPPNKKVILNGVTFELEPGESLAIVGASGTGKSTLARMLVGSIIPTAGSVRLDLMDLRNWDARQFGESVGYLPQDVQLFPASIKANIARMRDDATDAAIFDAAEMADVHEMISEFAQGYETMVTMDGSPLSGGQRQRIGLARAFFGNPRLVVLDEPNSNLDSKGERALAAALIRAKERSITVVAVTQRPALLKSVDKIMLLHNGAVQALGKRDDMLPILSGKKNPGNGALPSGDGFPVIDG